MRKLNLLAAVSFAALSSASVQAQITPDSSTPSNVPTTTDVPVPVTSSGKATAESSAGGLVDIVVTAQKRSEKLQNVPITVNALSGIALTTSRVDNQVAIRQIAPNISFNAFSNYIAPFIRGIGSKIVNVGLDPSSSVYLDDQYFARAGSGQFNFTDIERIEVLKGPQGTLYGRNAVGGAIRIITKDPVFKNQIKASASYASYNRVTLDGTVNLALTPNLAIRVTGNYDRADGYLHSIIPGYPDGANLNQKLVFGKLLWKPTERLTIKLRGDYGKKRDFSASSFVPYDRNSPGNVGVALGGKGPTTFYTIANSQQNDGSINTAISRGGEARADYAFDPVTISSITTYRHVHNQGNSDLDGTTLAFLDASSSIDESKVFTQELQAVSTTDGPLSYTAGLFYFHEKGEYGFCIGGLAVFGPGVGLCGQQGTRTGSIAPYGEATYAFNNKLKLTLGARYTIEKKNLDYNVLYTGPTDTPISGRVLPNPRSPYVTIEPNSELKFKKFTPKITVSYKVTPQVLTYATYSTGFKSGGYNIPTIGVPVSRVNPENLKGGELGAKFSNGKIRVNGAGFYYRQKDLQVSTINPVTNSTTVENAGKATIYGLEGDFDWAVTDRLTLGGSAGYLHGRFDEYIGSRFVLSAGRPDCAAAGGPSASNPPPAVCLGYTSVSGNFKGNHIPNAPDFTGNLRATYAVPLGNAGDLTISANASYTAREYFSPDNGISQRPGTLLSSNISWTSANKKYTASVFGTNLTKRRYYTAIDLTTTGGYASIARPREIGLRVGVDF